MKLPFIAPRNFRIVAHRGASGYAPENTAVAFRLATQMGATEIELDVQLASDEEIVVCHEPTLEKYGYQGLAVSELTWPELSQLDMGSWFSPFLFNQEKMMKLSDLFDEYQTSINYHIEVKGDSERLRSAICKIVEDYGLQSRVILTSFSYDTLTRLRYFDPSIKLGWLVHGIDSTVIANASNGGLFQICARADLVSKELVAEAQTSVSEVRAWGITGTREQVLSLIEKVLETNCDGVTINWPDWIRHGI